MSAGGVVAAGIHQARLCRSLVRADHVHDALTVILHAEIGLHVELDHVLVEGLDLQARDRIGDPLLPELWERYGPPWPPRSRCATACARATRGLRMPAGWSPRERGGGRFKT